MGDIIFSVTAVFQIFVFAITMYYFILAFMGLRRKDEKKNYKPEKKFAMIVAAHNEEVVIGKLIESMLNQNYPKELIDIFVIADNCTDNTAKIARKYGVNVYERFNDEQRGKGFALEWMFAKIFKMKKKYDAIAIFDADNLVSKNWCKEINSKMLEGYKVVQGYIDSKNPNDSWIATSYSIAFWSQNRMYQLARANVGLSNQIGGTGFAIDTEVLQKLGWGATCLTEDLEFSCKLVLNGEKVGWAHDAIIYDEKPLTLKQSWVQRRRWMQGFTDVASRYFFKLIKRGLKEKKWFILDCALYVIQPFLTLMLGISLLLTVLQVVSSNGLNIFLISYLFGDVLFKALAVIQFLITPLIMKLDNKISSGFFWMILFYSLSIFILPAILGDEGNMGTFILANVVYNGAFLLATGLFLGKKNLILFFRFLLYALYTLTWIPITIQGMLKKNNKDWNPTKHVRSIEICDV
ncbi:glycosyltransferase family 2 protein [Clostridium septicum]|uniref:Glycosyl transferase family 2 n=1 Tax=Clostridium septicum TaxID=1504 RepID=A0A9N7PI81_CLOSE|nr:glycosyltransferase family 2 protein [Clostridium septicum]AYE33476.1 glycosyl transferase family 2 [Clostridium septicum]QAS61647.1 glycosyltransferase [Clostridium septicum]UEC21915.1 glycosyltransferase [Clostridium septicum]USS00054.1 glycosyltransferase [Clostridium septicum]WLF68580.1 glycosyltransferase family 2 protein [Clostridium septicum]